MVEIKSPPARLMTGIFRLDHILRGGLLRGASYLIVGPPGSGKTIIGNQISFHHVSEGGRALYVTLLSESHARMLTNIGSLRFFEAAAIPEKIRYVSGYRALEELGLKGLLELVQREVRDHRASLLVLDGLHAAEHFAPSNHIFKKFIQELQAYAELLECTTLLLSPMNMDRRSESTASTAVDGVIELNLSMLGPRALRELSVVKFRGSECLLGKHEMEISDRGLTVHPRTEVQFDQPSEQGREDRERMGFGIPRLDEMLNGGLLSGSATTLLGAPGAGKTVLGLHFLSQGAKVGQPGLYFGFFETPPRLIEKAQHLGIDFEGHVKSGAIELQWQPPLENHMDALAAKLLERIRAHNGARLRLFVDGVSGFRAAAAYPDRMGRFLSALSHQLRVLDVTSCFTEEAGLLRPEIELPIDELAAYSENIILLRYVELRSQLYRLLSVMKMRESAYDPAIREFTITRHGIQVAQEFSSAEAILTGQARFPSGHSSRPLESEQPAGEKPPKKRFRRSRQ